MEEYNNEEEGKEEAAEETTLDLTDFDIRGLGEEELVSRIRFIIAKYRNRPDLQFVYTKLDLLKAKADEIEAMLFTRRIKLSKAERELSDGFKKIEEVAQALSLALQDKEIQGDFLNRYADKIRGRK